VTLAAAIHFDLAINNFGIQEYMPHQPQVHDVFRTNYRLERGHLYLDDKPGIGVDIDEQVASRFPYSMACLPIARLSDGTLHYW
jgi:mannonate dehydratase